MANSKLLKMLAAFKALQDEQDSIELRKKILAKNLEDMMPKLVAVFDEAKMQSVNINGAGTYYIEAQTFPKVEDNDTMIKWFRTHKLGSLVKETINWQTLRGEVNDRLKLNLPLPEGITTYNKRVVKLRGSEGKK